MSDTTAELSREDQCYLLRLARRTLEQLPSNGTRVPAEETLVEPPIPQALMQPRGVFVTLHAQRALRGCIGYVTPAGPLYRSVIENAVNAARRDPRFDPVSPGEVGALDIEISVMTLPRKISNVEEIEVGRHGLIISQGYSHGLLLPQVATEHGWDRDTFLEYTCTKAGLPRGTWREKGVTIEVFSAQVFSEHSLGLRLP
jgi:AmmeMemoRadiSam system protein A